MAEAIVAFEKAEARFDPKALQARAARFDRPIFARRVQEYIEGRWRAFQGAAAC